MVTRGLMPGAVSISCSAGMQQPNSTTGLKVLMQNLSRGSENAISASKGVLLMFNFSANHLQWLSTHRYSRCNVHILQDQDTKRCYKVHDFVKKWQFEGSRQYAVSGKVNSTDKIYLVLETVKEK